MKLPDPERTRRHVGALLFLTGIFVGGVLLVTTFVGGPVLSGRIDILGFMCLGAFLALPAGTMYLTVPRLLDRYDPEPWYALVGCILWGGIAACGFSAVINSSVAAIGTASLGSGSGEALAAVVSAPLVEEFWKGVGVLGVFYFLRREFDGVVDGIIYATFVALGFATIENVIYYARAASGGGGTLAVTFILRGIIAPWGHPVYTSMIGIGLGVARETRTPIMRVVAPALGYLGAVLLHAIWNGSATLADASGSGAIFFLMLPVWFVFVAIFLVLIIVLVRRRGLIIKEFLEDEIALNNLSREEVRLVASAFGLLKARLKYGPRGAQFVRAAARLALSKWHTARAMHGGTKTVSMDFIVPLRNQLAQLRVALQRA